MQTLLRVGAAAEAGKMARLEISRPATARIASDGIFMTILLRASTYITRTGSACRQAADT